MLPLRPLCAMVSVAGLLACQPPLPPPPLPLRPAAAAAGGDLVLVLAPARLPVVERAMTEIALQNRRARGPAGDAAALLGIDFRRVGSAAEATAVVAGLLPQIDRYRAIFTPSQTFARAAQRLAPGRPIVFDGVDDPVANCLVDSLRHPGRNATGYMHQLPDAESKMLELLHDGFPGVRRVVVLVSATNDARQRCRPDGPPPAPRDDESAGCRGGLHDADAGVLRLIEAGRIAAFGHRLGLAVRFMVMCDVSDFPLLSDATAGAPDTGVIVPWHSLFDEHIGELVAALALARRPAVFPSERFTRAGGVLSIAPVLDRGRNRASVLTLMQVIDGRSPAGLPVQTPRGFEIVFNAAAAAQQGLQPSRFLLRRADRTLLQ